MRLFGEAPHPNIVRQQLSGLAATGLIERTGTQPIGRPGRPPFLWSITDKDREYIAVTNHAFDELADSDNDEAEDEWADLL